ncbi:hypothetical protein BCR33DRAFT_775281, partial [Rhizoclosmatium globosum]
MNITNITALVTLDNLKALERECNQVTFYKNDKAAVLRELLNTKEVAACDIHTTQDGVVFKTSRAHWDILAQLEIGGVDAFALQFDGQVQYQLQYINVDNTNRLRDNQLAAECGKVIQTKGGVFLSILCLPNKKTPWTGRRILVQCSSSEQKRSLEDNVPYFVHNQNAAYISEGEHSVREAFKQPRLAVVKGILHHLTIQEIIPQLGNLKGKVLRPRFHFPSHVAEKHKDLLITFTDADELQKAVQHCFLNKPIAPFWKQQGDIWEILPECLGCTGNHQTDFCPVEASRKANWWIKFK